MKRTSRLGVFGVLMVLLLWPAVSEAREKKFYFPTGELQGVMNFQGKKSHGPFTYYHRNGQVHVEGVNKDGEQHGVVRYYNEQGILTSEMSFEKGTQHGPYKHFYDNGKPQMDGYANNGVTHDVNLYYETGQLLKTEVPVEGDPARKLIRVYYENGEIKSESESKDGKRHGVNKGYTEKGHLEEESHYVDGKLHGEMLRYDWTGKKEWVGNFENGRMMSGTGYDKNGRMNQKDIRGDDGKLVREVYYDTGELKRRMEVLDNGTLHGRREVFFKSGTLMEEISYQNGEPEGEGVRYYESGKVERKTLLSGGALVSGTIYDEDGNVRAVYEQSSAGELLRKDYDADGKVIKTSVRDPFHPYQSAK